jgi:HEAT repeat protein
VILLNKLFFYLHSISIPFKYSIFLSCVSITGQSYGMDNKGNSQSPMPLQQQRFLISPPASSLNSNEFTIEQSSSFSLNFLKRIRSSSEVTEGSQPAAKRRRPPQFSSSPGQSTNSQILFQAPLSIVDQMTPTSLINLDNSHNSAQCTNSQARYRAPESLEELIQQGNARAEKEIIAFSGSRNRGERSTASRVLADLVHLNPPYAYTIIERLGGSLNEFERETASQVLAHLIMNSHVWASHTVNLWAYHRDCPRRVVAARVLFQLLAANNSQAIPMLNHLLTPPFNHHRQTGESIKETLPHLLLINHDWVESTVNPLIESNEVNVHIFVTDLLEYLVGVKDSKWAKNKLMVLLSHSQEYRRRIAAKTLSVLIQNNSPWAVYTFGILLNDSNESVRPAIVEILSSLLRCDRETLHHSILKNYDWTENTLTLLTEINDVNAQIFAGKILEYLVLKKDSDWAKSKLMALLSHPQEDMRELAAIILSVLVHDNNPWAVKIFAAQLEDSNESVRSATEKNLGVLLRCEPEILYQTALINYNWKETTVALLMKSHDLNVRVFAGKILESLVWMKDNSWAKDRLIALLSHPQQEERGLATVILSVLIQKNNPWAINTFGTMFKGSNEGVRSAAEEILGILLLSGDRGTLPHFLLINYDWTENTIVSLMKSQDVNVRIFAGNILASLVLIKDSSWAKDQLIALLSETRGEGQGVAINTLSALIQKNNPWAINTFGTMFKDSNEGIRSAAEEILGILLLSGDRGTLPHFLLINYDWTENTIVSLMKSQDVNVRIFAGNILASLVCMKDSDWAKDQIFARLSHTADDEREVAATTLNILIQNNNLWAINIFKTLLEKSKEPVRPTLSESLGFLLTYDIEVAKTWVTEFSFSPLEEKKEIAVVALKVAAKEKEKMEEQVIKLCLSSELQEKEIGLKVFIKLLEDKNEQARRKIHEFLKSDSADYREIAATVISRLISSNSLWAKHLFYTLFKNNGLYLKQIAVTVLVKLLQAKDLWAIEKVNTLVNSDDTIEKEVATQAYKYLEDSGQGTSN